MRLYSYAACSTCLKALSWLRQRGLAVETIDITQQPPTPSELRLALDQLGRKALLNTSGKRYRELGAAAVAALDDQQLLEALAADGRLIKRPVLITDDQRVLTGFKLEAWEGLLG
ncbi:MAG: hypothetical protein RLZZ336_1584 [Cyanobacteriota bacterium]